MIKPIVEIAIFVLFMLFTLFFMRWKKEGVDTVEFKNKYGAFMTNVETFKKPSAVYYSFLFLLNRLIIALTVKFLDFSCVF